MPPRFKIFVISRELFQVILVSYLLLTVAETFRPGSVSNFFSLNYLLIGALITGISMTMSDSPGFAYKIRLKNK